MRIMIAEDHPVTRRLLQAQLTKWGYEVVSCSDGTEAWKVMSGEDAPRIAILDWMMPEMTGPVLCKRIRESEPDQRYAYIILLTAKDSREDILAGLEAGADDYVVKPFDSSELKVRVRAGARIVELHERLTEALRASEYQATHDALTRLWNREAVLRFLEKELTRAEREKTTVGVIIGDIDRFKSINDQYGHLAGDSVLRHVADKLASSVRGYDSVARYGGEEFIVVLPNSNAKAAFRVAERARSEIAAHPARTREGTFHVTMSFGVAVSQPYIPTDVDSIIRAADKALYRAKNEGRNRVVLAEEESQWKPSEESRPEKSSATSDRGSQMVA
ncbi:MAG: diguanylate cyclase [Desulfomonilaceae bacterium]|nr:diguanylate cyclase [Desulfomonilaceae bacterium]